MEDLSVLKPGDEVAVSNSYPRLGYRRGKVKSITPSGQIVLENGTRFTKEGREQRARQGRWDNRSHIFLMTAERSAGIEKEESIEFIKGVKWQNLDNKVLAQVVAVLKQQESEM